MNPDVKKTFEIRSKIISLLSEDKKKIEEYLSYISTLTQGINLRLDTKTLPYKNISEYTVEEGEFRYLLIKSRKWNYVLQDENFKFRIDNNHLMIIDNYFLFNLFIYLSSSLCLRTVARLVKIRLGALCIANIQASAGCIEVGCWVVGEHAHRYLHHLAKLL